MINSDNIERLVIKRLSELGLQITDERTLRELIQKVTEALEKAAENVITSKFIAKQIPVVIARQRRRGKLEGNISV